MGQTVKHSSQNNVQNPWCTQNPHTFPKNDTLNIQSRSNKNISQKKSPESSGKGAKHPQKTSPNQANGSTFGHPTEWKQSTAGGAVSPRLGRVDVRTPNVCREAAAFSHVLFGIYMCIYIYNYIYIYADIWYMCSFLLVSCVFSYFNPLDRSRCFPVIYDDR